MASLKLLAIALLIGTGLHAYFNTFLRSLGVLAPVWTTPFFSEDLFGDFIKLGLAYSKFTAEQPPQTFFTPYKEILSGYISSNPYSSDPSQAGKALTYFHLPPLYHIIMKAGSAAMEKIDPVMAYFLIVFVLFTWIAVVSKASLKARKSWILFSLIVTLSYPSLFAIQRGNITAYISSLLIISSFALAYLQRSLWLFASIGIALAVAIRPNYILLMGFIPLVILKDASLGRKLLTLTTSLVVMVLMFMLMLTITSRLVPGYSYDTFSKAYSFYVNAYELGWGGINYCSSPFRLVAFLLVEVFPSASPSLIGALRLFMLGLGILVTLWGFWLGYSQTASPSKSLFISLCGNVISTPVFADYHLLVFFAPILLCLMEKSVSPLSDFVSPGFTGLELITTGLLLSPKSLPLFFAGKAVTIQLLVNPLVIFGYLGLFIFLSLNFRLSCLRTKLMT